MYSGNNHLHFGTSNNTNKSGTLISADFPKYGINFNQSSASVTDLESALNFIANAYNNYTKNLNSTKIVIDSVQTSRRPRFKHVHHYRTRPNQDDGYKKLFTHEELARILKDIKKNSEKNRKNFFFNLDDKPKLNSRPSSHFYQRILGNKEDKNPRSFNFKQNLSKSLFY